MDEPVAVDPGHMLIDLGNDQGGVFDRRLDDIHTDSQAHKTMVVRRGSLDQRHIDMDQAAIQQVRHLGKKDGRVIRHPRLTPPGNYCRRRRN